MHYRDMAALAAFGYLTRARLVPRGAHRMLDYQAQDRNPVIKIRHSKTELRASVDWA